MPKKVYLSLDVRSVNEAIKEINRHKQRIDGKLKKLCFKLAEMGATNVSLGYARAVYSGEKNIDVSVEEMSNGYAIIASGKSVLFVEFGAGARYGAGHPDAEKLGMGPGTYPDGKGHWDEPKGWWIPKDNGGGHTYGNPPNPVMYETAKELRNQIQKVAMEVFASG